MEKNYKIKCQEGYVKAILFTTNEFSIPILTVDAKDGLIQNYDETISIIEALNKFYGDSTIKFEMEEVK